jgi:NitT/TauT family transport system substrate-binding protein
MKTRLSTLIGAVGASLALLATPAALAQGKGESVKFQDYPGTTGNMLIRVAISKGYCEKAGIKCSLQPIPSAPLGAQAMMAKSIDSFLGPASVMNDAVQKGAKMKMVVGGSVANVLILTAGNHIETPNAANGFPAFMKDFKGKKIGVTARGAATEVFTSWMLIKAGMSPEDVTYVAVGGPNTAYGALSSKQVDATMIFEPTGAICDVLKTCKRIWTAAIDKQPAEMYALNGGGNGLVFTQEFIDRNPHVIEAVIKAVKEADAFLNNPANFAESLKIAEQYVKFDMPKGDEVLATMMRAAIASNNYRAAIDRKAVQASLDLLIATKQIEKALPLSELIYDKAP